ncbi:MAG: PfkB family carbohydrate kinase, partial [Acidaminobacteraceae bacterium]
AGDSFVAGLGYGYMNELNLFEAVKFAVTMANLTISHEETIHPDMTYEVIKGIKNTTEWVYKDLSRK